MSFYKVCAFISLYRICCVDIRIVSELKSCFFSQIYMVFLCVLLSKNAFWINPDYVFKTP